ncbi:hypothetical protein L227DRAFT_617040 [Lentinus tigrinus ALCF2SS1-6]|uniref:DUF6533 domain-containing protein n=1 Tax=Lentinus tigrinus ALCF2SS1-6 TaxID=1328759 RepID=A0A5C2RT46_9APHY|nr:hypothetical protein L227DRAFT_617040 [Lentinus tigrinus ALCF2SS1-6]
MPLSEYLSPFSVVQSADPASGQSFVDMHGIAAISALCFYDYIITFALEVNLFWGQKITGTWIIFILNRYLILLNYILSAFYWMPQTAKTYALLSRLCSVIAIASSMVNHLLFFPWAAFSGLRTYALSRSRLLGILVFVLSIAPAVVKYMQFFIFDVRGVVDPIIGCHEHEFMSSSDQGRMYDSPYDVRCSAANVIASADVIDIVTKVTGILSEVLVILVTWRTTYRRGIFSQRGWSLSNVFLFDGTIYFIAILALNILNVSFSLEGVLVAWIEPITAVLTSRFLLDLQQANRRNMKLNSDHALHISMNFDDTPSFVRTLGAIASTITPGGSEVDDELHENSKGEHSDPGTAVRDY